MADDLWTFGEPPLAETRELAALLRDLAGHALALEHATPALHALLDTLRVAEAELRADAPSNLRPRVAHRQEPERRVYLDHSRQVGDANPCFPVYELHCHDDRAEGTVELPIVYEGPPGTAHGGVLALLFDCVLQQLNCDLGVAGRTTDLTVSYRRPVPLLTPLTIVATRVVDGERIRSSVQLLRDGTVLCEGSMTSVAGSRADLPAVSPRRPA